MAVKIRLQRGGRKKRPFYHIVVSDARAPRDGRYIDLVGSYNPTTNPATIELDFEKSVSWLHKGAQPTDTVRAILSYKGALYKKHLDVGVTKGALTDEQAEQKFNDWLESKKGSIDKKKESLNEARSKAEQEAFDRETKRREERAKAVLAKNSELAGEVEAASENDEASEDAASEENSSLAEENATENAEENSAE